MWLLKVKVWCWAMWMSFHFPAHSSSELCICIDCATGISLGSWILVGNFYSKFWAVEGHLSYSVGMNSIKRRGSFCPELPILSSSLLPLDFTLLLCIVFPHSPWLWCLQCWNFLFLYTPYFWNLLLFLWPFEILSISRAFFARQAWYREK